MRLNPAEWEIPVGTTIGSTNKTGGTHVGIGLGAKTGLQELMKRLSILIGTLTCGVFTLTDSGIIQEAATKKRKR